MKTMKFVVFAMVAAFVGCACAEDATPVAPVADQAVAVAPQVPVSTEPKQDVQGVVAPGTADVQPAAEKPAETMQPEAVKPAEEVTPKDMQPATASNPVAPVQEPAKVEETAKPVAQPVEPAKEATMGAETKPVEPATQADANDKKEETKDKELEEFLNMLSQEKQPQEKQ